MPAEQLECPPARRVTGRGARPRDPGTRRSSRPPARRPRESCSLLELRDVAPRACVEDLLLREPRATGLRDAELRVAERADRVRIGVDRNEDARLACETCMGVAHVETIGLRVDLESGAR